MSVEVKNGFHHEDSKSDKEEMKIQKATPLSTIITSGHGISTHLLLCTLWSSLGSLSFGMGGAVIGYILVQPNFVAKLHLNEHLGLEGAVVSFFHVGGLFGLLIANTIGEKYGRKALFLFASFWTLFGMALFAGAQNIAMAIVGRAFTGLGSYVFLMANEIYIMETAPASSRGTLGICTGIFLEAGYIVGAWIGFGFYFDKAPINWRLPLIVVMAPCLVLVAAWKWAPESPRWLISKGRSDEALEVLKRLHYNKKDPDSVFARSEHYQIVQQFALDATLPSSWVSMVKKYRKRTAISIFVVIAYMGNGGFFLAAYGPMLYAKLGYSVEKSLAYQAGWTTVYLFNVVMFPLIDRIGRRLFLILGITGDLICFVAEAALVATYGGGDASVHPAGKKAAVAMLFIFTIFTGFAEPPTYLVACEVFPLQVRTKGVTIAYSTVAIMNIWIGESSADAIATIGWKAYLVFICLMAVNLVLLYFFLPETANVPLEELAGLFGDHDDVAIRAEDVHVSGEAALDSEAGGAI